METIETSNKRLHGRDQEKTDAQHAPNSRPSVTGQRLLLAYHWIEQREYQKAMDLLTTSSSDVEERNAHAVCLLRLNRFEDAYTCLRPVVIRSNVNIAKEGIPRHVWINFATALFFGGRPAGAFEILAELRCETEPAVQLIRQHERQWVAGMTLMRRFDWWLNRIAPPQLPLPPTTPVGILNLSLGKR